MYRVVLNNIEMNMGQVVALKKSASLMFLCCRELVCLSPVEYVTSLFFIFSENNGNI